MIGVDEIVALTNTVAEVLPGAYCIEAVKLLGQLLAREGVETRPLAADVWAGNAAALVMLDAGVPHDEWPAAAWSVGVACDSTEPLARSKSEPYRRSAFGGHLVLTSSHGGAGDWFIDPTSRQFDRPDRGIRVPPTLVGPVDSTVSGAAAPLEGGGRIQYRWRFGVKSWRNTPAWRQDLKPGVLVELRARALS